MNAQDMRELSEDELKARLNDTKDDLFKLRFQLVTGQADNPRAVRNAKRDIARILTVLRERDIAAAAAVTD